MELLAPAGDRASLEAALSAGADAVYLGLEALNARRGAGNFDGGALADAAAYCHERAARVYVTVNTLVKQAELPLLEDIAASLARAGADAAIVQDLGAALALRAMLPSLPLHASTQMAIHNRQGVRFLKANGFSRAILARELTFEEIADCAAEGVELEVFGHGALCTACSGQCLFSSLVGGRSGNRGMCAQPCRLPYQLAGPLAQASGDLLSPKDLMTITHLAQLKAAGAVSVKLEGRLKGPEYVYAVTRAYRAALDGEAFDPSILTQVFNRGYTAGYGPGVTSRELMTDASERHVQPAGGTPPPPPARAISLTGALTVAIDQPIRLTLTDGIDSASAQGPVAARAERAPADAARLSTQVGKLGGTPYRLDSLALDVGADAFVPVSAVNALRRDALLSLGEKRAVRRRGCDRVLHPLPPCTVPFDQPPTPLLAVESADAARLKRARDWGADECVWSPGDVTEGGLARSPHVPFTLALPPTLTGDDLDRLNAWARGAENIIGVIASNPAHLMLDWPGETRADAAFGTANALTVQALNMPYAPSVELTAAEIRALPGERELIVYGRVPLMLLRHCPLSAQLAHVKHADCHVCDRSDKTIDDHRLIDRKGVAFPLSRLKTGGGCIIRVLNSVPLNLLRRTEKLPPARRWRVMLTDEDDWLAEAVVRAHRAALNGTSPRALPDWARLDAMPSTTGHYFRGVE